MLMNDVFVLCCVYVFECMCTHLSGMCYSDVYLFVDEFSSFWEVADRDRSENRTLLTLTYNYFNERTELNPKQPDSEIICRINKIK